MLKWIAQNKYKLMTFIIGLYLLADVLHHQGKSRVLLPKKFPVFRIDSTMPESNTILINTDKAWKKGINTMKQLNDLPAHTPGFECDVYFDTARNNFKVQHDARKGKSVYLNDLLNIYRQRNLTAGIWLDIKNLDDTNAAAVLQLLIQLRDSFKLENKILVESGRAHLLTPFSDSGFFTSYYTPMFNPYLISDEEIKKWVDSIAAVIQKSKLNALSGYYFQYPFLQHYFPGYPVLTWCDNDSFSVVNWLFKRKLTADKAVLIVLYP